jgi:hypothetical protein
LSIFGVQEDISILENLIHADTERRRQGEDAFRKGEGHTPRVNGFRMDWSDWHVNALCRIDPKSAEKLILNLLDNHFYEGAACSGLIKLLKVVTNETRGPQPENSFSNIFELLSTQPISSL